MSPASAAGIGTRRRLLVNGAKRHSFKSEVIAEAGAISQVRMHSSSTVQGYLLKQSSGRFAKRWQRRYFQVSGKYLRYFASGDAEGGPKGAIRLCDLCRVEREACPPPPSTASAQLITLVFTDGSHYLLKAGADAREASEWVRGLEAGMRGTGMGAGMLPALGVLREHADEEGGGGGGGGGGYGEEGGMAADGGGGGFTVVEHLHGDGGERGGGSGGGGGGGGGGGRMVGKYGGKYGVVVVPLNRQLCHVLAALALWWVVVALVHSGGFDELSHKVL